MKEIIKKMHGAAASGDENKLDALKKEGVMLLQGLDPNPESLTIQLFRAYMKSRNEKHRLLYLPEIHGLDNFVSAARILSNMGVFGFMTPLNKPNPAKAALAMKQYGFDVSTVQMADTDTGKIPVFVFTQRNQRNMDEGK